jgi:hypothetical protein
MNPILAYAANQVNDPLMMVVIGGLAVIVVGFVLYNAFTEKKSVRRDGRENIRRPRRPATESGRF